MKRFLSLLLMLAICLCLFGCGAAESQPTTEATPTETTEATEPTTPWPTGKEALDGKKVIFIGNSYTFCGYNVLTKQNDVLTQEERSHDHGFFYQLCKANGLEVAVTNWSFGSHQITDFFGRPCETERECLDEYHEYYLKDPYFDYVVFQCHNEPHYTGDLLALLEPLMTFFREANPNVKFVMHVPHMAYHHGNRWLGQLPKLTEAGIRIANWGELCYDVLAGTATVPGATQEYTYHSFVINWREDDGFHQNVLAGYLTSLMVYCAITGESAVGQPYLFTNDSSIHPRFSWEVMKATHYSYDPTTNFIEIFQSEADMNGLQQLADQYLAKYNGGN